MKKILLEYIMLLALLIMSGIVLADDFFVKSDNELFNMREQTQTIETKKISTYPLELKNRMKYRDTINQIYLESNRNRLMKDNQVFYVKSDYYRYKTVVL